MEWNDLILLVFPFSKCSACSNGAYFYNDLRWYFLAVKPLIFLKGIITPTMFQYFNVGHHGGIWRGILYIFWVDPWWEKCANVLDLRFHTLSFKSSAPTGSPSPCRSPLVSCHSWLSVGLHWQVWPWRHTWKVTTSPSTPLTANRGSATPAPWMNTYDVSLRHSGGSHGLNPVHGSSSVPLSRSLFCSGIACWEGKPLCVYVCAPLLISPHPTPRPLFLYSFTLP